MFVVVLRVLGQSPLQVSCTADQEVVKAFVSAGGGEVSTLPSRGPKRRLVPVARLDELLSRAATVGVGVGHRAAQFFDVAQFIGVWCLRCGLSRSLAVPAAQVVCGGLAGGEE